MKAFTAADPNEALCPAFDADVEYYLLLTDIERRYWSKEPLQEEAKATFRDSYRGKLLRVEWRRSEMAVLPSLVLISVSA